MITAPARVRRGAGAGASLSEAGGTVTAPGYETCRRAPARW
ncbi:hypothetical protein FM106_23595 [Brachybacterium faecium]|nr:hypothetical protein FM106_23595 [Brachybacterium faecium]